MKKTICVLWAITLIMGMGGCSQTTKYQDGIYFAQADNYDEGGWMDAVTIEVTGGKIVDVDWNAYNKDNEDKKTLSELGEYDMVAGGAKSQWHEQVKSMETTLITNQDISKITVKSDGKTDAVSGVTMKVDMFAALSKKALDMAK